MRQCGACCTSIRIRRSPPQTLLDLFPAETVTDLEHMLRKADRMGSTTSQMEIATARVNLNVAVTVASLDPPSQRLRAMAGSAPVTSWCWKI